MAESEEGLEQQAFAEQQRILAEESPAAGGVEVRVLPHGEVVIRVPAAKGVAAPTSSPCAPGGSPCAPGPVHVALIASGTCAGVHPCATVGCACAISCAPHPFHWLAALPFTAHQEAILRRVIRAFGASRGQVLERLGERALARLVVEEAEIVLREAAEGKGRGRRKEAPSEEPPPTRRPRGGPHG